MAHSIVSRRALHLAIFCTLISLSFSSDEAQDANTDVEQKVTELNRSVTNLERDLNSTWQSIISDFNISLNGVTENLPTKSEEFKAENLRRIQVLKDTVMKKLTALESTVNSTKQELAQIKLKLESKKENNFKLKCKPGWKLFGESCYYTSNISGSWDFGRSQCQKMDADYTQITSDAEFDFVSSILYGDTWTGLTDSAQEGTFRWISDNTVHTVSNHRRWWGDGEPNDTYDREDCIDFQFTFGRVKWNDINCQKRARFSCEMVADKAFVKVH